MPKSHADADFGNPVVPPAAVELLEQLTAEISAATSLTAMVLCALSGVRRLGIVLLVHVLEQHDERFRHRGAKVDCPAVTWQCVVPKISVGFVAIRCSVSWFTGAADLFASHAGGGSFRSTFSSTWPPTFTVTVLSLLRSSCCYARSCPSVKAASCSRLSVGSPSVRTWPAP